MENSQQVVLYELMLNSSFKKKVEEKERKEKKTCGTKKKKKTCARGPHLLQLRKSSIFKWEEVYKMKGREDREPGIKNEQNELHG